MAIVLEHLWWCMGAGSPVVGVLSDGHVGHVPGSILRLAQIDAPVTVDGFSYGLCQIGELFELVLGRCLHLLQNLIPVLNCGM